MKKILGLTALLAGATLAGSASANPHSTPVWTVETPAVTINAGLGSISLGGHTYTFTDSLSAPVQLAYYNSNPGANSQAAIASFIKDSDKLGLTNSTVLTFGVSKDSISGSTTIGAQAKPYDYLAVHVGGGELLFHWTAKVTAPFTISGSGLSNYRAYISPVPEPETYAMLLAGFGVLGFMARRRKQK
ncbi:FxDxF family PEP-CTERM protein [Rugamonas apoptosis]|uniref:PEP-CTERM sorting domain-containing protein n=1 Tax=Rugamonas apoptosis TaxID=2758570 RepID=A0A7W2F9F8_9BURK|nr:FxDxF family PEP-CTERM protein [Rugamonas apoptosis]MBA5687580.1 PEP-CTERM sorting domain-containing protein [Rugamonas apoptosis]